MKNYHNQKSNIFFKFLKMLGTKYILEKVISIIYIALHYSKIRFLRGVFFNTSKLFQNYIYLENEKEKFLIFTKDKVLSKHYYVENPKSKTANLEFLKFTRTVEFLNNNFYGKYNIDTLFDIGANIGFVCIPALTNKIVKKVYAVEPDKNNFKLLNINKLLNDLGSSLELYNYALSSKNNEILNFELSYDNFGDHRVIVEKPKFNIHDEESRIISTVTSRTFDNLFPNINPKKDLIWMDTQGFEPMIIEGGKNLLASKAPIVIEFWPYALIRNNLWIKMRDIIEKFDLFCDLSEDIIKIKKVNKKNINKLFIGWDKEKKNQYSLFTDLLLIKS